MKKGMQKFLQMLLVGVMVISCVGMVPSQAEAAAKKTEYVKKTQKSYSYDSAKKKYKLQGTTTYTYNKAGLVISEKTVGTGYSNEYKYTYNKAGKKLTEKLYEQGKLVSSVTYTYDSKGRIKKESYYDNYFKSTNVYTYSYSKDGKSGVQTSESDPYYKTKYTYYSNGNVKTAKTYSEDGLMNAMTYNRYGYETSSKIYTNCESSDTYADNYYYADVEVSKLKKNKVASDVLETVTTYSNSKKGIIKKEARNHTFYNESGKKVTSLSYKGKVYRTYYTSGYRTGYIKSDSDVYGKYTYVYKKVKGKNLVSSQVIYDSNHNVLYLYTYSYKKITK